MPSSTSPMANMARARSASWRGCFFGSRTMYGLPSSLLVVLDSHHRADTTRSSDALLFMAPPCASAFHACGGPSSHRQLRASHAPAWYPRGFLQESPVRSGGGGGAWWEAGGVDGRKGRGDGKRAGGVSCVMCVVCVVCR